MRGKQLGFPRLSKKSHDNQVTMIATIVQEAIKAEREACAKACFNYSCKKEGRPAYQKAAEECERAIRARGEE